MNKKNLAALMGLLNLMPAAALAADQAAGEQARHDADPAVVFSLLYRADVIGVVSGGIQRGATALGNLDLKADIDLDRSLGWEGVSLGLHGIASHGGKPNARLVGSSQGVDNIEVDTNTAKLFQAWIQKTWNDDRASLLFGLYDLNSEFYVSHSTPIFLHPAPGIGSEFAQSGRNGPSVFPTSSLALRFKYQPTAETYVQAALLDAVPGDPDDPRGTHIRFDDGDGTLRVAEVGYIPKMIYANPGAELPPTDKYALGYWSYTARFEDLVDVDDAGDPVMRKGDSGFYMLAEKILYLGERPGSHVDGFVRYGRANADVHPISSYFQTGLVFTGMLPRREEDQFALSFSVAQTSDKYRQATSNAGGLATRNEAVWEVTYRAPVTPWLIVQPNLQYVVHPGADAQIDDATVLGIRFEMSLEASPGSSS